MIYSKEFQDHFSKASVSLKGDSIIFPVESGLEVILIPQYLLWNKDHVFIYDGEYQITIRQINYTDIEFNINLGEDEFFGLASIQPHFYLGMESIGFSDGEYWITYYKVVESNDEGILSIGLGNQSLIRENQEAVYATIIVSNKRKSRKLQEISRKKFNTVANTS